LVVAAAHCAGILPKISKSHPQTINDSKPNHKQASDVVVADPPTFLRFLKDPNDMPNLKWLQSTYAGVDAFVKDPEVRKGEFRVTRAGGIMGNEIAQYVMSFVLAIERKHHLCREAQAAKRWAAEEARYRPLRQVTLGVLGVGDIGTSVAKMAQAVGMKTSGWKRSGEAVPCLDAVHTEMEANKAQSYSSKPF